MRKKDFKKVGINEEYLSKIVNTFKKRFKKHLESMIRFMSKPDIISWNNNKAERDLRPLCVQRKISGTMRCEKNSRDYLLLFSVYQTCEKRGINFMKFLLSRKKKIKPVKVPEQSLSTLDKFIRAKFKEGYSVDAIRKNLLDKGWNREVIDSQLIKIEEELNDDKK